RAAELAASGAHFEQAIALYDLERRPAAHRLSGHDPKVCCLGHLACVLWLNGHPAEARTTADAAVTWADELAHPPSIALALTTAACVQALGHAWEAVDEIAMRASSLAAEYGLVFFAAIATIQRGCALAWLDRGAEAGELLQAGLQGYAATGAG